MIARSAVVVGIWILLRDDILEHFDDLLEVWNHLLLHIIFVLNDILQEGYHVVSDFT